MIIKRKLNINIPASMRGFAGIMKPAEIFAVGGCVRDALLGLEPKDLDFEVYNVGYDRLVEVLSRIGKVDVVGKAFGVIKFTDHLGITMDISVPRRENKMGVGHRGFDVATDPTMTPKEAAERRDFTVNAIAYDFLNEEIHDYFNGLVHLDFRILSHTSEKFEEDPLRVLRAMQFQGRFGFRIDSETMRLMNNMVAFDMLDELPTERISEEWMKWATKSNYPELILYFLHEVDLHSGWSRKLITTPQDPIWHPEGTVFTHTVEVLRAAGEIARREGLEGDDKAVLLFAALTHDLGKITTTKRNEEGRLTAHGHEGESAVMAEEFLTSIGIKRSIIDRVVPLVANHLAHAHMESANGTGKKRVVRRLAKRLFPASIDELLLLIEADHSGRPPLPKGLPESAKKIKELADELGVQEEPQKPLIMGRHLIAEGLIPGKDFAPILTAMAQAQEDGIFTNEEEGVLFLRNYLSYRDALLKLPIF